MEREKILLKGIIEEYIKEAKPISSGLLVKRHRLEISPATVRNEMFKLEKEGYLCHPYTSSGKIPTEKAYKLYIENFLEEVKPRKKEKIILKEIKKQFKKNEDFLKNIAKTIANLSSSCIVVAFSKDNIYYTGIRNLFSQPEFKEYEEVYKISGVVDHLENIIKEIFDQIDEKIKILVGEENPFGNELASILTKYKIKNKKGLITLLGPLRMNYSYNYNLIRLVKEILKER